MRKGWLQRSPITASTMSHSPANQVREVPGKGGERVLSPLGRGDNGWTMGCRHLTSHYPHASTWDASVCPALSNQASFWQARSHRPINPVHPLLAATAVEGKPSNFPGLRFTGCDHRLSVVIHERAGKRASERAGPIIHWLCRPCPCRLVVTA